MTNPATEKNDEIPSMDKHWIFYGEPTSLNDTRSLAQRVVLAISRILCLVAFGWPNLSPAWERSHSKDKDWEEGKDSLRKRIEHTNVVAGLLLTTIAAFCSTDPPKDSKFFPYTKEGPTCLILLAFGLSFAGLIVGSAAAVVMGKLDPSWFRDVMMGTRTNVYLTMMLLGYPFWTVGTSTCCFAAGLLIAASYSESNLLRYGGYALLLSPVWCAFAFMWIISIERNATKSRSIPV